MSSTQMKVSQRFIDAMGSMVNDEQKVQQVVYFINTLSENQEPDDFMLCSDRDKQFIPIEESERTTLEMVHNHFNQVLA